MSQGSHSEPNLTALEKATDASQNAAIVAEDKQSLIQILKKAINTEITHLSLPVSFFEPVSFLQRMAESIQYADLLDKASECTDSAKRLMYMAVFSITFYASTERAYKPFNPILGETFEFVTDKYQFLAEQVSHHPPISVSHANSENWEFWQETEIKTKFKGNSCDVFPTGKVHCYLKKHRELYTWHSVTTSVNNIIVGTMWVDNFGETECTNLTTKEEAKIKYTQCAWFSNKGRFEVAATINDSAGNPKFTIQGKWNEKMCGPDGEVLWTANNVPVNKYNFNSFTLELNKLTKHMLGYLPQTDARLRSDRMSLEKGDLSTARVEKLRLEEKQRADARNRAAKGEQWVPVYFEKKAGLEGEVYWHPRGDYWGQRQQRIQEYEATTKHQ